MKKIIGKIGFVLEIIVIVLLFVVSLSSIVASKNDGVASDPFFGISFMPVESNSMIGDADDSFEKGDMIIAQSYKKYSKHHELEVGDIITYKNYEDDNIPLISHRIVSIENGIIYAQGDNHEMSKSAVYVPTSDIKCVYLTHVDNLGSFIDFFKDKTNYALFIVLPLVLLFAWNIYSFVKMFIDYNRKKQIEVAVNGGEVTEDIKEIALREYLARQKAEAEKENAPKQEEPTEEKKD